MKSLSELRPSTQKTYAFISAFIRERAYSPSTRDIRDGVPLSSTSVSVYHRDQLVKAGLIGYTPDRARSIERSGSITITLTFWDHDADYIREEFGDNPESAIMDRLKQEVGVGGYGT